jgi:transposase InsO family protein
VQVVLDDAGPAVGLPALVQAYPQTPPSILAYLQHEYREQFQSEHCVIEESLTWTRPGAVWAIDHSQPPRPIDGCYQQILAVRDLASGTQLAWTAVPNASAEEAWLVLEALFHEHGPPLVLKSDNGSAFLSGHFLAGLDRWQVVPLFSPVRMPRYNGACEAGIGAAKRRTEHLAARHGRPLHWGSDDLHAAWLWANHEHYPWGRAHGTPAQRFAQRASLTTLERDTLRAAIVEYTQKLESELCTRDVTRADTLPATIHRRAVRQALVELGYLDITRRSIPQPIRTAKCARIT